MEPITHFMTGACLARAGFNRKAAYATVAMTLAAEAPDLDTLWSIGGPVAAFQHHRGITHTFLGLPFEAALIVGLLWIVHRFRMRRRGVVTSAPVRWGVLWWLALLALLSHLLLDYTNNYGLRPFFPFNPHWYAGSIVFIFEPIIFAALLAGLLLPVLFGLISSEVGARRNPFRGRGWAIAALLVMAAVWSWRTIEQQKAIRLAEIVDLSGAEASSQTANGVVPLLRIAASPYPMNPYRWHLVLETPRFSALATADTAQGTVSMPGAADIFYKPSTTLAALSAKRSRLGHAYLDWSSFPVVSEAPRERDDADAPGALTLVTFRDLRFFYDVPFLKGRTDPPLTGKVFLDADRRVVRMEMDGRVEP